MNKFTYEINLGLCIIVFVVVLNIVELICEVEHKYELELIYLCVTESFGIWSYFIFHFANSLPVWSKG
jgi:hypothetical protein